ncbi:MAG: class IIb bacteriocin, lactobin A/cerein 7B family [Candidatus Neomarinimicrobiota bacterium]
MNKLNLNNANLVELTNDELVEIDGGVAICLIVGGVILVGVAVGFGIAYLINN